MPLKLSNDRVEGRGGRDSQETSDAQSASPRTPGWAVRVWADGRPRWRWLLALIFTNFKDVWQMG